MPSAGLAGFAQGLAQSPLGNLGGLLLQREQLQAAREDRQQRKEYREGLKGLIDAGDFGAARGLAMSMGDFGTADALGRFKRESDMRGLQELYATDESPDKSESRMLAGESGLMADWNALRDADELRTFRRNKERREAEAHPVALDEARGRTEANRQNVRESEALFPTKVASASADLAAKELGLKGERKKQFENNLTSGAQSIFKRGPITNTAEGTAAIKGLTDGEREALEQRFGIGEGRDIVGLDVIIDGQGRRMVTARIRNENTGTTGPWTRGASARGDDPVVSIPLEEFNAQVAGMAGVRQGGQEWHATQDGRVLYNRKDGTVKTLDLIPKKGDLTKRHSEILKTHIVTGQGFAFDDQVDRKRSIAGQALTDAIDVHGTLPEITENKIVQMVARVLSTQNALSDALMNPKNNAQYRQALQELYIQTGILSAPQERRGDGLAAAPVPDSGDTRPARMPGRPRPTPPSGAPPAAQEGLRPDYMGGAWSPRYGLFEPAFGGG